MDKITKFADIPRFTREGSYAADYPFHRLVKWVEDEEREMGLQLNPDFQRGHVWSEEQQIAFLEFFLRGGKTGRTIYFNCPSWHHRVPDGTYNDYVCVDGLQRITAMKRFVHNEIKVFGSYYDEYTDKPRTVEDTMRVNINDLKTKQEVLQWYIDMNSGGTPHTTEEIERVKNLMRVGCVLNCRTEDMNCLTVDDYVDMYQTTPADVDIWGKLVNGEYRLDSCWYPCVILYNGKPDPRPGTECFGDNNIYVITRNQTHLHLNKDDVRLHVTCVT